MKLRNCPANTRIPRSLQQTSLQREHIRNFLLVLKPERYSAFTQSTKTNTCKPTDTNYMCVSVTIRCFRRFSTQNVCCELLFADDRQPLASPGRAAELLRSTSKRVPKFKHSPYRLERSTQDSFLNLKIPPCMLPPATHTQLRRDFTMPGMKIC
jgi:hypothetical protein